MGKETCLGKPKSVNYAEVTLAFTFHELMQDDSEAPTLADRVFSLVPHREPLKCIRAP